MGPRADDALFVHSHPCSKLVEDSFLFLVEGAVAAKWNGEKQIAVLTDYVDEQLHDLGSRLVLVLFIYFRIVVPAANA